MLARNDQNMAALARLGADLWPGQLLEVRPFPSTPTVWASSYELSSTNGARVHLVGRCINTDLVPASEIQSEVRTAMLMSQRDIGPKVHYADPLGGVIVMDYIIGTPARGCGMRAALHIAALLRQLHNTPPPTWPMQYVTKRERSLSRIRELLQTVPGLSQYGEGLSLYTQLLSNLGKMGIAPALCHNDLNPTNILVGNARSWLIDFDHVGMGDPLFDVATAASGMGLSASEADAMLTHYLGRAPLPAERARVELETCVALLRYGLDALTLVGDVPEVVAHEESSDQNGEAFVFHRIGAETEDRAIYRLSRAFLRAGLDRGASAAEAAVAAAAGSKGA